MRSAAKGVIALMMALGIPALAGSPPVKLRALVLSGQNNHDWRTTTPALRAILERSGRFTVGVTEHPEAMSAAALKGVDVIVSNWNNWGLTGAPAWPESARAALLEFVGGGRGFVTVHAGSSSFYDWPEYQQMVGVSWRLPTTGHGARHPFTVRITDPGHPVTRGLHLFMTQDELWHRTGVQSGMSPLAAAFSEAAGGGSGAEEPIAFARSWGRGRSFALMLGHDAAAMAGSGFRTLLVRGAEWAATGRVTASAGDPALTDGDLRAVVAAVRGFRAGGRSEALQLLERHVGCVAPAGSAVRSARAARTAAALAALAGDGGATVEGRAFACRMLSLIGSEPEVPALAALLEDAALGTRARMALERIPGNAACGALRRALAGARGAAAIGLIDSLGARRDVGALAPIAARLGDGLTADAAASALGQLGTPGALAALRGAHGLPPAVRDRALLRCADLLAAGGDGARACGVYRGLLRPEHGPAVRAGAYSGLARWGSDGAGRILAGLRSRDEAVRRVSMGALLDEAGPELFAAAAARLGQLPADVQVRVLNVIAARRASSGLAAARSALASRDGAVRLAALEAVGAAGGSPEVAVLARAARRGESEERAAVGGALARLRGAAVDGAIAAAAARSVGGARATLVGALAARGARSQAPTLVGMLAGDGAMWVAPLAALAELGGRGEVWPLMALLGRVPPVARAALEGALARIAARTRTAQALINGLAGAARSVRLSLVAALGEVGGPEACDALTGLLASPAEGERTAALEALAQWADGRPLDAVCRVAVAAGQAPRLQMAALRGVAHLAPLATGRASDEVAGLVTRALAAATRPEERKALASALGGVASPAALRAAAGLLDDPEVSAEAGLAALEVADRVWRRCPDEAGELVRRLAGSPHAALRERAMLLTSKLSRAENLAIGATATHPDGLSVDGASQGIQAAIDGDPATYWDEDDNQSLYVLRVALAEPSEVGALRIMGWAQHNYAPKDFEVWCDGQLAKRVVGAEYSDSWLSVTFPPRRCAAVELRITGYYGGSPGVRELEIYRRLPAAGVIGGAPR